MRLSATMIDVSTVICDCAVPPWLTKLNSEAPDLASAVGAMSTLAAACAVSWLERHKNTLHRFSRRVWQPVTAVAVVVLLC